MAAPHDEQDATPPGSGPGGAPRVVLGLPGGPAALGDRLRPLGLEVAGVATSGPELARAVAEWRPDLVLLHAHLPDAGADLPHYLERYYGVPVILLVPARLHHHGRDGARDAGAAPTDAAGAALFPLLRQDYPEALLAEAERVGCPFLAAWPPEPEELRLVAAQALFLARRQTERLEHTPQGRTLASRGPGEQGQARRHGRVSVVWGVKGGVGKSALALNIACALGQQGGRRVLLVDLDVTNPSLHTSLGIIPSAERGLGQLARAVGARPREERNAPIDLAPYVDAYHAPEGTKEGCPVLHLLVGLSNLGDRDAAGRDQETARALLAAGRAAYDEVIIDLGTSMTTEVHPRVAAAADLVFLVVTPSVMAVEGTAAMVASLTNALSLNPARCRLVVNRVADPPEADDLTPSEIRAHFPPTLPLLGLLPDETGLPRGRHTPWILAPERRTRESALVRCLEALVNEIAPFTFGERAESRWERLGARLWAWRRRGDRRSLGDRDRQNQGRLAGPGSGGDMEAVASRTSDGDGKTAPIGRTPHVFDHHDHDHIAAPPAPEEGASGEWAQRPTPLRPARREKTPGEKPLGATGRARTTDRVRRRYVPLTDEEYSEK